MLTKQQAKKKYSISIQFHLFSPISQKMPHWASIQNKNSCETQTDEVASFSARYYYSQIILTLRSAL